LPIMHSNTAIHWGPALEDAVEHWIISGDNGAMMFVTGACMVALGAALYAP